jgi:Zn-dependent peptidase ImmA (M78 family)
MKQRNAGTTPRLKRAVTKASRLLMELNIHEAPIPVEMIATKLGLHVERVPLGDEISGVLVIQDGRGVIGVNPSHASVRQRFTIAHEIGHFLLHRDAMPVFIDKQFFRTYLAKFRDSNSSSGEDKLEREANAFAATLLMPIPIISKALKEIGVNISDEAAIQQLAERFNVSRQAMSLRIANAALDGS